MLGALHTFFKSSFRQSQHVPGPNAEHILASPDIHNRVRVLSITVKNRFNLILVIQDQLNDIALVWPFSLRQIEPVSE